MSSISVFGLGYVGSVLLACLADQGHQAIGVDVNPVKVDMINSGHSPIIEPGVTELLSKGVQSGRLRATMDSIQAVCDTDFIFVCVGTPSHPNGSLNLIYVERVCKNIGEALVNKPGYPIIVIRSTMLPGSTEEIVIPILEAASGKKASRDFGVCFNPEFLREGSSITDFYDPPYTILGTDHDKAAEALQSLYSMIRAPIMVVPFKVAEMVKYANNAFHALKVTFANEIGDVCKKQKIDSHRVMEIFCQDTKLNLSSYYLKPGFAFGGSCLPKDLRALLYHSRHFDLHLPVLESIIPSNRQHIEFAYQMITRAGSKRVGVLGFSFKAGTDDLRESPIVELIEYIIGKGYQVKVYDKNVSMANLHGANRAYIEQEIPHIASLMTDTVEAVLESSDVIVVGNKSQEFREALPKLRDRQVMIDLVRITEDFASLNGQYHGICW